MSGRFQSKKQAAKYLGSAKKAKEWMKRQAEETAKEKQPYKKAA